MGQASGAYADTKVGPPTYADSSAVARAYAKAALERGVWGSDWPHPSEHTEEFPDDAVLFDLLSDWGLCRSRASAFASSSPNTSDGPRSTSPAS